MNKKWIIFTLALGVFSIINTEMGVVGILPLLSQQFGISISKAGLFVSLFALAVAVSGPIMPLLLSGVNRKKLMLLVLLAFLIGNLVQAYTNNFCIALIARIVPAFFQPVYVSLAFSIAAGQATRVKDIPKFVAKVMMGVSAGMVLGVPVVSLLANTISLRIGMLSFTLVNLFVLVITWIVFPSMPVLEKLSYGEQVSVLKEPVVWISIIAVVFLNGATFGVYSYFAEYMEKVAGFSNRMISVLLFAYGITNMIGNVLGGKGLSKRQNRLVSTFPMIMILLFFSILLWGRFSFYMGIVIVVWGVLAGVGANINQYWIISVVEKAPDFGNGLFLAATNLGTTIGTIICGFVITGMGISFVYLGGILLFLLATIFVLFRTLILKPEFRQKATRGKA